MNTFRAESALHNENKLTEFFEKYDVKILSWFSLGLPKKYNTPNRISLEKEF